MALTPLEIVHDWTALSFPSKLLKNVWRTRFVSVAKVAVRVASEGRSVAQKHLDDGPTGVGKTEIARRMARLIKAPFIKVEATKFTEVGYVGRDVEQIIRDLVESAMFSTRQYLCEEVRDSAMER